MKHTVSSRFATEAGYLRFVEAARKAAEVLGAPGPGFILDTAEDLFKGLRGLSFERAARIMVNYYHPRPLEDVLKDLEEAGEINVEHVKVEIQPPPEGFPAPRAFEPGPWEWTLEGGELRTSSGVRIPVKKAKVIIKPRAKESGVLYNGQDTCKECGVREPVADLILPGVCHRCYFLQGQE